MSYRRVEASEALRPFVDSIWVQESARSDRAAKPTTVVPTCGVELIVSFGEPFEQLFAGGRAVEMPMALVAGQRTQGITVRATGRTGLVIARCHPWAARSLLQGLAEALADGYAPVTEVDKGESARTLADRVVEARSAVARVGLVESYLLGALRNAGPDRLVVEAVRMIGASCGRVEIGELSRHLAINRRQLHRRFKESIGVGAKRFARLVRFQRALGGLRRGRSWSDLVERCGYFDQAHWIREMNDFLGQPPGAVLLRPTTPLMDFYNRESAGSLNTTVYL